MNIAKILSKSKDYEKYLSEIKSKLAPSFKWYPYGSMNNFIHLDKLLINENRDILDNTNIKSIIDIGSADGDNSFFLESLGFDVDIVENSPTNYNSLQGAKLLKMKLKSKVNIFEIDLDAQFNLPNKNYDLVFFLGILYHLKNPYYALELLAKKCRYCLLSTRVTKFAPDKKTDVSKFSFAYLVHESETNNDASNFWMFTQTGLKRILSRTGWEILDYMTVGNTRNSDPSSKEGDERAFCFLKSKLC